MSQASGKDKKEPFDAKGKKLRRRAATRDAEMKAALMKWLEPRDIVAESVCVTTVLLDLALDRHVAVHEANGFELIEAAYQSALERWRGSLQ
jgi:hypothetical protein